MTYEVTTQYLSAVIKTDCDTCERKIRKHERLYEINHVPIPNSGWMLDDSPFVTLMCMDCRSGLILRWIAETAIIPDNEHTEDIVKWAIEVLQNESDVRDTHIAAGLLERTMDAERTQS